MPLRQFHPAARTWFTEQFGEPTQAQAEAWPAIKAGRHTLISAPTGSGKTLAAFYAVIDDLPWEGQLGQLPAQTLIHYVTPHRNLSNDIHRNRELPLESLGEQLLHDRLRPVHITVAVRSGHTTA